MPAFGLLHEPWIPVLWANGKVGRVGIKDALTQAGRIRQVAASNPMDRVAIVRFLLALLYWCKGNPPDGAQPAPGDSFPPDWFAKLDENRDCFNLLGKDKRFYQDCAASRSRAATDLLQEIPTGNNFWHFRHSTDKANGLCAACCAMGLLRLPLFSVSGLPDLKSGINGSPPVYALPWGTSLLSVLWANWVPRTHLGIPAWLQPDIRPIPHQEVPLLTGLTLLSRRVWLHDPGASGTCIGCGAREKALIRSCEFETAGEQKNDLWDDPHVVYLEATPRRASRAADLTATGKFKMDRPWPDLLARLVQTGKFGSGDKPASLLIVGFATDKAKNIDVWERLVDMPSATPIQEGSGSLLSLWQKQGTGLVRSLVGKVKPPAEKGGSRKHVEVSSLIASIRPHVEDGVSGKAGELIAGKDEAWTLAAGEYRPMMGLIARSLSPGFTTAAVQRRQQIARVAPDMRPEPEAAEKPARKKGGNK